MHVPYKSGGAMATAVLQGETQIGLPAIAPALPHVKSGRLRAIAVTAPKRSSALPDTPTFAEAGFPAIEADNWNAILAPAGTPSDVIGKLHVEIARPRGLRMSSSSSRARAPKSTWERRRRWVRS